MASAVAAQRVRPFIGREAELQSLSDLMRGSEARVACVHGIAGIGKSGWYDNNGGRLSVTVKLAPR